MYIKYALLENVGPIRRVEFEFPFDASGNPKPFVLVGGNGSGKSILLSHIVNSLISAKQVVFDDCEVEQGKVYKYRSPQYITTGASFYHAKLTFESELESVEWQLQRWTRKEFEEELKFTPNHKDWTRIPEHEGEVLWSNFREKKKDVERILGSNCVLYFPPNRYEEPGWLNYGNLLARAHFSEIKHLKGLSNRTILDYSLLKRNQDWLLDVLFDRQSFEVQTRDLTFQGQTTPVKLFTGYGGPSTDLYLTMLELLRLVLQSETPVRFGIGPRNMRQISIMRDEQLWVPNIFQLSTGQTSVLNLFLSILRDFDLTENGFQGLASVRGIVLVDEIDSHLHCELQHTVLPSLMRKFPAVQFIVTSHSPLFLLGLIREFGENGFTVLSLPDGKEIECERFVEFEKAYESFKESTAYRTDVKAALESVRRPAVFVEGDYDIRYVRKAASLLGEESLLGRFELFDGGGFGNLDNVTRHFDSRLSMVTPRVVVLLYDCDTNKVNSDKGQVAKRIVPTAERNPVKKGIENLFPVSTVDRIRAEQPCFLDVTPEVKKTVRGKEVVQPEIVAVNKDEKGNLCDWLCEHGTKEDFEGFRDMFRVIEEVLRDNA